MTYAAIALAILGILALVGSGQQIRDAQRLLMVARGRLDIARTIMCQAQMLNAATQEREASARDWCVRAILRGGETGRLRRSRSAN